MKKEITFEVVFVVVVVVCFQRRGEGFDRNKFEQFLESIF
jgi:hypothetical protein